MATPDVTVRGAGIFGLSIAWTCARRGARVVLVDPHGPGTGASGGTVGALAPHVPENWNPKKAFQLDSLLMAEGFWAEIAAVSGRDPGYLRSGRLQPLADDRQVTLARAREETARDLWQDHARWTVLTDDPAPGWTPPSPVNAWVHDTLTARIAPRAAGAALVAALATLGVEVRPDAPDTTPTIWATGAAGLAALSRALDQQVGTPVKGQSALLRHDAADLPQLYAQSLHIVPHADGTVAIGSTSERDFDDPTGTDAQLDDLVERARALVPALADAP